MSNRSRATVQARATSGSFQTRRRVALIKSSNKRVELPSRDQCLVGPAEHAIGLTRSR